MKRTSDTGMVTVNPYHRIMMDYQKVIIAHSDRLGFNPLARTKLEIKEEKEISEMEKLLLDIN